MERRFTQVAKPSVLYICYQSALEPLTETQVVSYLRGLAASGYRIILLTFEPKAVPHATSEAIRNRLARVGISWRSLRYHKRPTVPATAFDTFIGAAVGVCITWRHGIGLIHARSHVPALMAIAIKTVTRVRVLFDVRGLMAEEYADAGVWKPNGRLFRVTKRVERLLIARADAINTLTVRGRDFLRANYSRELGDKPLSVIPCCVDLRPTDSIPPFDEVRPLRMAYVGKFGGWYLDRELMRFVAIARESVPGLRFDVKTQSSAVSVLAALQEHGLADISSVEQIRPEDVIPTLRRTCDVALCFIKPCVSKLASSPTKVGEYLAAGLGLVVNAGIGDLDTLVESERVGVVIHEFSESAYRRALQQLTPLVREKGFRERCVATAAKFLSLEKVGWPRYREMYEKCTRPGA